MKQVHITNTNHSRRYRCSCLFSLGVDGNQSTSRKPHDHLWYIQYYYFS